MSRGAVLAIALGLSAAIGVGIPLLVSEQFRVLVFDPNGSIAAGTKFGVGIGMTEAEAHSELRRKGFERIEVSDAEWGVVAPAGPIRRYRGSGWVRGVVVLTLSDDGKVERIKWSFILVDV